MIGAALALLADFISEYLRQLRRFSLLMGSVWVAVFLAASLEGSAPQALAALGAALVASALVDKLRRRAPAGASAEGNGQPAFGAGFAEGAAPRPGVLADWRPLLDEREQSLEAMLRLFGARPRWTPSGPTII